ncbi:hypothetical protein [Nitrosomonas communis]|uniref:Uncharacterized protein n=1 Tax=Nitrosomonas communis TaxID=44574 RepID=A0A1I4WZI2_9PROT|nr:hypothetical protein [Nitrosomonas communis]SFN18556.1 hypothetical protein SAMN05421863_11264 [Nitrosomonas communis]
MEIKVANGSSFIYGALPIFRPFKTFSSPFRNKLVSWKESWKLLKFLISDDITTYVARPEQLDKYSTLEYAQKFALINETIKCFIVPFTSALFFLLPSKYSAYVFFGPMVHALRRLYRVQIGAFRGGMSKVLIEPIAHKIIQLKGNVITNAHVTKLNHDGKSPGIAGGFPIMVNYEFLTKVIDGLEEVIERLAMCQHNVD